MKIYLKLLNNDEKLIGYLTYQIDYYSSRANNFGLISFDKGNPIIGKELFYIMEELVNTMHRIEWHMISGNPVEKTYDKIKEENSYQEMID